MKFDGCPGAIYDPELQRSIQKELSAHLPAPTVRDAPTAGRLSAGAETAMNVKMLVIQGQPAGKTLLFAAGEYYFGRGAECHVRPNSEWVSRQHCLLRVTAEEAYLRDLGSRNGTLVNGRLLHEEQLLRDGDQVQIGPLVFEIRLEAAMPPSHEGATAVSSAVPWEAPTAPLSALRATENLPAAPSSSQSHH